MSVIGPMKKFDPLPIPFQSVPIETESEKIGTRLIGIGIGVTRYLDAFPYQISLPVVPLLQFKCMLYIKGRTMKESVFAIMHDVLKIAKLTKVGLQSVHL